MKHKSIINRILSKGTAEEELHQICAGGPVAEMVADLLKICTDPEGRFELRATLQELRDKHFPSTHRCI